MRQKKSNCFKKDFHYNPSRAAAVHIGLAQGETYFAELKPSAANSAWSKAMKRLKKERLADVEIAAKRN